MKTITLREDTYLHLLSIKEKDDSFSDVIDRILAERSRGIRPLAGGLGDSRLLEDLKSLTTSIRQSGRSRV
jgi:predicted CopG family antitoxin